MVTLPEHRSPFVYWAQNKEYIFLKIEIFEAKVTH